MELASVVVEVIMLLMSSGRGSCGVITVGTIDGGTVDCCEVDEDPYGVKEDVSKLKVESLVPTFALCAMPI